MAIQDNASIALIPSGYKSGKLYSVIPDDGDGDFTFSRSNTTATRVAASGLIENVSNNVPRLDYPLTNGVVGDCPHLLLEPQRTNSLTYSTLAFNGSATPTGWAVGFGTGTFSHTETTYKGQGAVKHTQSTTGRSYLSRVISLSASTTYTLRVEFDRSNSSGIDDNDYIVATANMSNSFTKQWADVDDDGILEVQFTTGTDAYGELRLGFGVSGNEDGGKTIVFSMPQIEAGSYATSYIPTTSTSVTRSADACNGSGTSAEFNGSEGVLFVEFEAFENGGSTRVISISDGSTSNNVYLNTSSSQNTFTAQIIVNGSTGGFSLSTTNVNQTNNNKIAIKYKTNDHAMWVNGTEVDTHSSHSTANMGTLNRLNFDFGTGSSDYYGKIKQVMVFKTALSDSELETLTS